MTDLIRRLKALPQQYATAQFRPLSTSERKLLSELPNDLADRVYASAMRSAWDEYIGPACELLDRNATTAASELRYEE